VLEEARRLGFLGPGPALDHLRHARAFASAALERLGTTPGRFADLGTGGGVPGLVLACAWPESVAFLVEAKARRAQFLRAAVESLGLARAEVLEERAEVIARRPDLRASFDLVTARSFARPAVVSECGAPLLRVGGWLLVSEPPAGAAGPVGRERWPGTALSELGLGSVRQIDGPPALVAVQALEPCSDRYPRRVGIPSKRPLF